MKTLLILSILITALVPSLALAKEKPSQCETLTTSIAKVKTEEWKEREIERVTAELKSYLDAEVTQYYGEDENFEVTAQKQFDQDLLKATKEIQLQTASVYRKQLSKENWYCKKNPKAYMNTAVGYDVASRR